MIGSHLLELLLKDNYYDLVRILVRRPVDVNSERLEVMVVNFENPESVKLALDGSEVVFSSIGTTNKNVGGNKKLYWQIDHDIPVSVCRLAFETGCKKFIFVSSLGAEAGSKNFYLKLKGQTEQDIIATSMPEIHIMRPGMLLGDRKEKRPFEKLMQVVLKALSGFMVGHARQYRAIEGVDVAKAMIATSKLNSEGVHIYSYNRLIQFAHAG